ncbi:MAG: hypothetical protein EB060_01870 [Proteobacteria bacterium]|nr:hypothetical protein [Pseudomonadota bacterium]
MLTPCVRSVLTAGRTLLHLGGGAVMKAKHCIAILLLVIATLCRGDAAEARSVVADLAIRSIDIDHNFAGIDILLFGARNDVGDIVVVVRGPEEDYVVRKKARVAGVWVNRYSQEFKNVNGFYAVATSRSLKEVNNDQLLEKLGVGVSHVPIHSTEATANEAEFREALIRSKQKKNLYSTEPAAVTFWGDTLFRTVLTFPKNILKGQYTAEVYLFNDGQLTAVQTTPLGVNKIGFEAFVYDMAYRYPVLYGIVSVMLALLAGWVASVVFQR